jgi:hypothetical protein
VKEWKDNDLGEIDLGGMLHRIASRADDCAIACAHTVRAHA